MWGLRNIRLLINCGDYEISNGHEFSQLGFFIKTKLYKLRSERVKREIISERVKEDKSLIYIDGVGAPQKL